MFGKKKTVYADAVDKTKGRKNIHLVIFILIFTPLLIAGTLIGALFMVLYPMRDILPQGAKVIASARELESAIKSQDLDKAKAMLAQTRAELMVVQNTYKATHPIRNLPFLGEYVKDGERGLSAAFAGLDAGDKAIQALEPNADLLGLKGESKFVAGSADERIQVAVKTMTALIPKINDIAVSIDTLQKQIDQIDPMRYPEELRGIKVRQQIRDVKELINNSAGLFVNAQPLLKNLPSLLGEPNEKRYLVLFQNDKELRPTGGFLTAYAQFRLVRGKIILETADDIYALDGSINKRFPAPDEIVKFHKGVNQWFIRDSNLSPDFKLAMRQFEEMYAYSGRKEKIDGIWALDTNVLVEVIKVLGPQYAYGREFSAEIDKRCDCPKAVYELEDYATRPVNYVREARKDIIGVLMRDIMQKALGVSPSQYWGRLFQVFIDQVKQKHILAYFKDDEVQKAAESFNLAGRIATKEETPSIFKYKEGAGWDYLHINNTNFAGAKANLFTTHKVTSDVKLEADGSTTNKVTITYTNSFAASNCDPEAGMLCLNAPLRNWLRVYVPAGSKLLENKGSINPKTSQAEEMTTYDQLGKTVFEGFLIINPKSQSRIEFTYKTPKGVTDGRYQVLVQKQPGTRGSEYVFSVNGKEKKPFVLSEDTEIIY